jgi:hypothetical protein
MAWLTSKPAYRLQQDLWILRSNGLRPFGSPEGLGAGIECAATGDEMEKLVTKKHSAGDSEIARAEYNAITLADSSLAWKVFSDHRRWNKFVDAYGAIRWVSGTPWAVGSRLQIELAWPVRMPVNRVITMCRPNESVAWIDHARGSTVEEWVVFEPQQDGGTHVRTWAMIIGSRPVVGGEPFVQFVQNFLKLWFDGFCKECDRLHKPG